MLIWIQSQLKALEMIHPIFQTMQREHRVKEWIAAQIAGYLQLLHQFLEWIILVLIGTQGRFLDFLQIGQEGLLSDWVVA
ncbi:hypothetical protein D3C74_314860 [compost metagenome]